MAKSGSGVGFLEFAGAPISSVPVRVIAGALASVGDASLGIIGLAAALIVGAGDWRLAKVRIHRERHAAMRAAAGGLEG